MRIAQVAPLAESVPPKLYGGTERVVAWLTEELIALGHDVTLFATGDSATSARLVPTWPRALRLGRPKADPAAAETALLELIAEHAQQFDVVHCHTNWTHLPLLTRLGVPFLTTLHNQLDTPGLPDVFGRFPAAPFISISNDQRTPLAARTGSEPFYHGLPADSLSPCNKRIKGMVDHLDENLSAPNRRAPAFLSEPNVKGLVLFTGSRQ
jgi:glycosyltransferase involved in cell wall biosynthesis